jgi:hypothetical protein
LAGALAGLEAVHVESEMMLSKLQVPKSGEGRLFFLPTSVCKDLVSSVVCMLGRVVAMCGCDDVCLALASTARWERSSVLRLEEGVDGWDGICRWLGGS